MVERFPALQRWKSLAVLDGESTEGKSVTVYHRELVEAYQVTIDYVIEGYRVTILPISLLCGSGLGLILLAKRNQ